MIQLIDSIGGRFEPSDPFQRFRRRAFTVMLMILAFVCLVQGLTAWFGSQSSLTAVIMSILLGFILLSIGISRRSSHIEPTASLILSFLVVMGAALEIAGGRSPNTPLVYWSPVMIFGAYVFCGLQRGTLVAGVIILSTLAIVVGPFLMDDARILPGGGNAVAFQKRLFVTVSLCHFLPLAIVGMFEKFFDLCHVEAKNLFDRLEGRKDRAWLGRLAQVLVGEMEPELKLVEKAYYALGQRDDVLKGTGEIMEPLQKLVHLTRRFEPLSQGALATIEKGLELDDLPALLRRFTDFADIQMEGSLNARLRFQDGHSFLLLIILCLSVRELIEHPGIDLQRIILRAQGRCLQVLFLVESEEPELRLALAQDFLHDLEARIQLSAREKGTTARILELSVPLLPA
jgi:hypothetical protein